LLKTLKLLFSFSSALGFCQPLKLKVPPKIRPRIETGIRPELVNRIAKNVCIEKYS
jgi:hypothetical protein